MAGKKKNKPKPGPGGGGPAGGGGLGFPGKRPPGPPNLGMPQQGGPQLPPNKAGFGGAGPSMAGGPGGKAPGNYGPGGKPPMPGGGFGGPQQAPQAPPAQPGGVMANGQSLGAVGSSAYNAYLASIGKSLDPMGNVVKTGAYIPQGMLPGGPTGVATYQNQGGGLNYDPSILAKFQGFTDPSNIPQGAQGLLAQGNPGTYGGPGQMPPGGLSTMPPGGGVPNQPYNPQAPVGRRRPLPQGY